MRRYQDLAFRVALTIVGSVDDAEDAAQDGFVRAFRALHQFRGGAPLRPWLLTIVANSARTRRTAANRLPTLSLDRIAADTLATPALSPEAESLVAEQHRELLAAVHALRDDDQHVIVYRYFLGLSEAETADVLRCPRGTVKSRLSRALGRLRQRLASDAHGAAEGRRHA